jgi:hypothetical protein
MKIPMILLILVNAAIPCIAEAKEATPQTATGYQAAPPNVGTIQLPGYPSPPMPCPFWGAPPNCSTQPPK